MPNLEWNDISDWDSSQDSSGINHNNDPYTSSDPSQLKQGYQKQWPPMTHGLVGWWPLHTDTPVDLSGNENHGTKNGGITTGVAGKAGLQAYSFDGTDDSIALPSIHQFSSYTVAAWVKPRNVSGGEQRIVTIASDDGQFMLLLDHNAHDDKFMLQHHDGSWVQVPASSVAQNNDWYFVVGTWDSSTAKLWVNGTEKNSKSVASISTSGVGNSIGNRSGGYDDLNFDGKITAVRLYSRALSPSEVQTLYEWGSSDQASPPTDGKSYYRLDGDATDSWSNNDGTTNGGISWSNGVRGQAASFDGSDDYIDSRVSLLPTSDESNSYDSPFSVSAWVEHDGSTQEKILSECDPDNSTTAAGIQLGINSSGNLILAMRGTPGGDFLIKEVPWNYSGELINVTAIYDGSRTASGIKIYINGEQQSPLSITDGNPSGTSISDNFVIGARGSETTDQLWKGKIDEVRVYPYALQQQSVQKIYRYGTRGIDMNKFTVMQ